MDVEHEEKGKKHKHEQTLNSMIPLWKKDKKEIKDEDYNMFYTKLKTKP